MIAWREGRPLLELLRADPDDHRPARRGEARRAVRPRPPSGACRPSVRARVRRRNAPRLAGLCRHCPARPMRRRRGQRILGPGVLGIAAAQLLADGRIAGGPEAGRDHGSPRAGAAPARADAASSGIRPSSTVGVVGQPEQLLQLHRQHRRVDRVVDRRAPARSARPGAPAPAAPARDAGRGQPVAQDRRAGRALRDRRAAAGPPDKAPASPRSPASSAVVREVGPTARLAPAQQRHPSLELARRLGPRQPIQAAQSDRRAQRLGDARRDRRSEPALAAPVRPSRTDAAGDHRLVARLEADLLDRRDSVAVQASRCSAWPSGAAEPDARLGPGIVELGHGEPSFGRPAGRRRPAAPRGHWPGGRLPRAPGRACASRSGKARLRTAPTSIRVRLANCSPNARASCRRIRSASLPRDVSTAGGRNRHRRDRRRACSGVPPPRAPLRAMPCARAVSSMWASRGCSGSSAMARPCGVIAPVGVEGAQLAAAVRARCANGPAGGWVGKRRPAGSRTPQAASSSASGARSASSISAGRCGGRPRSSSTDHSRRHRPGPRRPARPLRCSAEDAGDRHGHQPAHAGARPRSAAAAPARCRPPRRSPRWSGWSRRCWSRARSGAPARPDRRVLRRARQVAVERKDRRARHPSLPAAPWPGGSRAHRAGRRARLPATAPSASSTARATRSSEGSVGSPPRCSTRTGNSRPSLRTSGAPPRCAARAAPSSVADMTSSRRSGRSVSCTSRHKASPRSASSERSWNSSKITAP